MFSYLYEWIKNITCYIVLATAFIEALPLKHFKKYIRFFIGMLFVLLLIRPFLYIKVTEASFLKMLGADAYEMELQKIEEATKILDDVYQEEKEELYDGSEE